MTAPLGARIIDVLEQAGERYLKKTAPDAYAAFLLQVGGADTLRVYEASATYWERVQAMLDSFFTSAERAEIAARLIEQVGMRRRPELRTFLDHARAEHQLQGLIAAASAAAATRNPQAIAVRRGR
ncbi:MAG TPA: hypothetical protein VLE23_17560 [Geminicoccaceae bacterium]|nr:hypothetical protein [Geminicoccaceae bacterium]